MRQYLRLHFLVHFPPIGVGVFSADLEPSTPLFAIGIRGLVGLFKGRFVSEGKAVESAVGLALQLNYFNRNTKQFLDRDETVGAQRITADDVIIISLVDDADTLAEMLVEASPLLVAEWEIKSGK